VTAALRLVGAPFAEARFLLDIAGEAFELGLKLEAYARSLQEKGIDLDKIEAMVVAGGYDDRIVIQALKSKLIRLDVAAKSMFSPLTQPVWKIRGRVTKYASPRTRPSVLHLFALNRLDASPRSAVDGAHCWSVAAEGFRWGMPEEEHGSAADSL